MGIEAFCSKILNVYLTEVMKKQKRMVAIILQMNCDRILKKVLWEESDFHVLCHLHHPHHPLAMATYDLTKPQVMKKKITT